MYSLDDIKAAWEQYDKARVLRVLKDGKWETLPAGSAITGGTRAEVVPMKKAKSFPEFLEEEWKK